MGAGWGRVFYYVLMCTCVVWNIFNLIYYGGSMYNHRHYVAGSLYVLACLLVAAWCVFAMVMKYKRDRKEKCKSCEK